MKIGLSVNRYPIEPSADVRKMPNTVKQQSIQSAKFTNPQNKLNMLCMPFFLLA
jgi:hypothetical protein